MKTSLITIIMAAILASTALAAGGFLASCSEFAITNLNGGQGRSMMLQANCKVNGNKKNWSQLDLNRCFGWTRDACGFTYPPASGFTDAVGTCSNHYTGGEEHFGANFGCFGPCRGGGTVFNVFALSKSSLPSCLSPLLRYHPLMQSHTDQYIGNANGHLVC